MKRVLLSAILGGAAMVSQAELVGEWTFDEGSGITVSNTAGNGVFNGIIDGVPAWVTGHDGTGYALDFSAGAAGTNGMVTISDPSFLDSVSNQISIAMWTYSKTDSALQTCGFQGSTTGDSGNREIQSHLPWENGNVYWDAGYNRLNGAVDSSLYTETGEWVYWVFTKNSDTGDQVVYANGERILYNTAGAEPIDGAGILAFSIGAKVDGALPWPGYIDDFKVYDHELTYNEIAIGYDPFIIAPVIEQSGTLGEAPFQVIFTGTNTVSGQGVAEYLWDFGEDASNMVIGASGGVVTNTFADPGTYTVTLYVVDNVGATNSATTSLEVLAVGGPADIIELMVDADTSSEAYYGSSVTNLLTDTFDYFPSAPTASTPSLDYQDGFHGNESDGADIWLSYFLEGSASYTTVSENPVIIMDVWGRNYTSAKDRDDDFDVELYNGSWDAADMVGYENGAGVEDSSNYTRVTIDTLPVGTTFDRVRIVGHNSREGVTANAFTLCEIRLVAVEGDVVTVKSKVTADPVSGYYPLEVAFDGSESYAVATSGSIITDYLWDFGDGNTDSGVQVTTNTYTEAGVYTNTLSVVNSLGETNSAEVVISANNPIDVAITASNETAYVGVNIYFDAAGTTNYVTNAVLNAYTWDFGDGSSASGMTASHAFAAAGTKTVTLTVEDDAGRSNTGTIEVYILAAHELSLDGSTLSWDTSSEASYEVQYNDNLTIDNWTTYTNVTGTPPETSVEIPLGQNDIEFYRVIMQ